MNAKTLRLSLLASLAASMIGVSGSAFAEETPCTGAIGAVALDNIFVPDGATCMLTGTRLNGNIVVGTAATLQATRVTVNGSIQAEGANRVVVQGNSTVGGSVQIVQGSMASIDRVRINGDLMFDSNSGALAATRNNIGGNLQAFQNTGGLRIANNFIKGNLQCKENNPAPTGGSNQASSKEDQCSAL